MNLICMKVNLLVELIFIWMVSHVDSEKEKENSEMAFDSAFLTTI